MKRLFSISVLIMTISIGALAQDSAQSQESDGTRTGYGYGGRAEVFVTAFGLLPHETSGNAISAQATKAGGGSAGYRFRLNASTALEGRYGFSRNSQKYTIGRAVYSIPVYVSEISGSYVYKFANRRGFQPFLEGGGGLVLFSPGNYGGGATSSESGTPANGFGYPINASPISSLTNADSTVPAYGGSSGSLPRQAKGMLVYGAGVDVPASSHLYFRVEFRAAGYKLPDFGATALHTGSFTFAYEPSVGLAYRF
jgi:hypothetical protein